MTRKVRARENSNAIPLEYPLSDYHYGPDHRYANESAYPIYGYEQFYRSNPAPEIPNVAYGEMLSYAADVFTDEELEEAVNRLADANRKKAKDRWEGLCQIFGESHPALVYAKQKWAYDSGDTSKPPVRRARRNGGLAPSPTVGIPTPYRQVQNAGPYLPQMFPFGAQGYPATYALAKTNPTKRAVLRARDRWNLGRRAFRAHGIPEGEADRYVLDYAASEEGATRYQRQKGAGAHEAISDAALRKYGKQYPDASRYELLDLVAQDPAWDEYVKEVKSAALRRYRRKGSPAETFNFARINPFTVFHADHGISPEQMSYIQAWLGDNAPEGFFIRQIDLPRHLGSVPNALYGPDSGDAPVPESRVHYMDRAGRGWVDRMIDLAPRPCNFVQVIGIRSGDDFKLFTVYGGPLAPMNPADPNNPDPEKSRTWWSKHALASAQWAKPNRSRRW